MSSDRDAEYDVKRCAKCAAWIPTSATMCAYCGTSEPDKPLARPAGPVYSVRHGVRVTNVLIAMNFAYLVLAALAEALRMRGQGNPLQWILTGDTFEPGLWRAGSYSHVHVADGQWWRILSATFLHYGILHIGLNMFALRDLGRLAEELFGAAKFITVYVVSAASSTLAISVWYVWILKTPPAQVPPLVGASGAIFGVDGLLVVFLLRAGTQRARAVGMSLLRSVLLMLFLGWIIPFVSNTAHVGGLLTGIVFGMTMRDQFSARTDPSARRAWTRAAAFCVAATIAALAMAVWFALTAKGG